MSDWDKLAANQNSVTYVNMKKPCMYCGVDMTFPKNQKFIECSICGNINANEDFVQPK